MKAATAEHTWKTAPHTREVMRTTAEETERNNKKILDAAIKVFAEKGYVLAEIQDIAQEAGISKGPLYYRYKSKRELFIAALAEEMDRELSEYAAIWSQDRHIMDILHDDFESCLRNACFGLHMPDIALITSDGDGSDDALKVVSLASQKLYGYIELSLLAAKNKGELKADADLKVLEDTIFIFSNGLYQVNASGKRMTEVSLKRIETAIDEFLDMIEKKYCDPEYLPTDGNLTPQ